MEYLSNFSSEAEYLANYSKLKFPNISIIDDGIDTTVVFEKESHTKIDIKNTEIKHNKSKYSVGDLFIYDKSHQAFGVYSFEEIKVAQSNSELSSNNADILYFGMCVIPDNFITQESNMANSLARFITLNNLNKGTCYLWDQCDMDYNGYKARHGLLDKYNTAYGYPILNKYGEVSVFDIPQRYELVATLPFDDGVFKTGRYVRSTQYSIENYVDPGLHWDYSCIIDYKTNEVNEDIPVKLDFAPSPFLLNEDGTYSLNPEFSKTTDMTGALCNGKPLSNGVIPNPFLDMSGIYNTYALHKKNVENGNTDFEAAEQCYNYNGIYNVVSDEYKGWFYIPAAGELSFIVPRINKINTLLSKFTNSCLFGWGSELGTARDPETGELKPQEQYLPTHYWSSTQANANNAQVMRTFSIKTINEEKEALIGGHIGPAFKFDTVIRTRPFFMIKPNYNEGSNILILRVNDNHPNGQLVNLDTIGNK